MKNLILTRDGSAELRPTSKGVQYLESREAATNE